MIVLLTNFDASEIQEWLGHLERNLPSEQICVYPEIKNLESADVALVANPPVGVLASLPNLKLIQSLWAGVDSLFKDSSFPKNVPLARLVDPALTQAMIETVLTHTLALHRQIPAYAKQQQARVWNQLVQPSTSDRTVGILGLGHLGRECAAHLERIGFRVIGWSSRPTTLEGITTFDGQSGLQAVLEQSEILVNLLPLTDETRGILNVQAFQTMPAGSSLINVARGAHVIESDLIAALDSGHLEYAILDVFTQEPLPEDHAFWQHPKITLLPHIAATTNPLTASKIVAQNVQRLRASLPLENLVDRSRGY
jgi:glyoxylate/hydroxypyruvate reductase